jgi:two-component system response regulator NreC
MRKTIENEIKVILADDHTILRSGLRLILNQERDIEVVGEAEDGRECLKLVEELLPDIVLMDIAMPSLNGLEATRQIKKRFTEVDVLILTAHDTEEYIYQVFCAGASGYLLKKTASKDLVAAIRSVYNGHFFISPSMSKSLIEKYIEKAGKFHKDESFERLTGREREILQLIAEGKSNKEIAEILNIALKTVEVHRAHLMEKLDIHNTASLTRYAIKKGIVGLEL